MKNYPLKVTLRSIQTQSNDLDFIYSTFIKSLQNQYPFRSKKILDLDDTSKTVRNGVDKSWFTASTHAMLTQLLNNCNVIMATEPGDDDQIFGYIIYNNNVLHGIYSKFDFRNAGVGTRLMAEAFKGFKDQTIEYTINTSAIRHLETKWKLRFNSYHLTKVDRGGNNE